MASIGRDKRTNKIVIRAYAGVNPTTKKPRIISTTLPADSTDEEIAEAATKLDERAEVSKRNSSKMTISSIVHYYLDNCELTDMSPATLEPYNSYARRHVDPRIGSVLFDDADAYTFSTFYRALREPKSDGGAGLAITTVEKIHAMLSGCFNTLKADGDIDRNPLLGVKVPRGESREVRPLMPQDFSKLVAYLKKVLSTPITDDESFERYMFAVLVWDCLNSGLRRSELAGFRVKHWTRLGGEWSFRVAEVLVHPKKKGDRQKGITRKKPKSKKSKRPVSMDDTSAKITNTYLQVMRKVLAEHGVKVTGETQLFIHADGSQLKPKEITEHFKALVLMLKLEKDVHLHTLRHTHASYLLEKGASLKDIQERLGHAKIETTGDIYGHLLPGRDSTVARMFTEVVDSMAQISVVDVDEMFAPTCPISGETCARFMKEDERSDAMSLDVETIVKRWLRNRGYQGLCCEECGCDIDDLFPCCEYQRGRCKPAYRFDCYRCTREGCEKRNVDYDTLFAESKDFCRPIYKEEQ